MSFGGDDMYSKKGTARWKTHNLIFDVQYPVCVGRLGLFALNDGFLGKASHSPTAPKMGDSWAATRCVLESKQGNHGVGSVALSARKRRRV